MTGKERDGTSNLREALFVPNAPFLIDPQTFGGLGLSTARRLRELDLETRLRPDVIVVCTPHFMGPGSYLAQASSRPPCLHDFYGFPPALSEVTYEPPGDPGLAVQVVEEARSLGLPAQTTTDWGLDHGAWAPLLHLAPSQSTPVLPLSISPRSREEHIRWGQAVAAALREKDLSGVFVGTGSILHRLDLLASPRDDVGQEGAQIETELAELACQKQVDEILRYPANKWRVVAPEGDLKPLFSLFGTLPSSYRGERISVEQHLGAVGMTILRFGPPGGPPCGPVPSGPPTPSKRT